MDHESTHCMFMARARFYSFYVVDHEPSPSMLRITNPLFRGHTLGFGKEHIQVQNLRKKSGSRKTWRMGPPEILLVLQYLSPGFSRSIFPTCQVRVVRFYVGEARLLLLLPSSFFLPPPPSSFSLAGPHLPALDRREPRQISSASS